MEAIHNTIGGNSDEETIDVVYMYTDITDEDDNDWEGTTRVIKKCIKDLEENVGKRLANSQKKLSSEFQEAIAKLSTDLVDKLSKNKGQALADTPGADTPEGPKEDEINKKIEEKVD